MKVRSYYKTIVFTFFISAQGDTCEYIDDQYERRRSKYNDRLTETSFVEHTKNTNKLLSDYNKVSNVPATFDQKKSIIKTTMTKFFVHTNPEKDKLSFRALKENDKNYRHFKILERTEALSCELAKQLIDKDGVKTIDLGFLSNQWNDHKELDEFGKITQEMFALWFNEALADHNKGLSKPIASAFDEVEVLPTSPQRFTPNLSTFTIDGTQKNSDEDLQYFSPITHTTALSIGKELLNDSDTQSENSSAATTQERLSDTTTPEYVDESLKINDSSSENAHEENQDKDFALDSDKPDDTECISSTEDGSDNTNENEDEWDFLGTQSPGKNSGAKKTQSLGRFFAGVLQKINPWS